MKVDLNNITPDIVKSLLQAHIDSVRADSDFVTSDKVLSNQGQIAACKEIARKFGIPLDKNYK